MAIGKSQEGVKKQEGVADIINGDSFSLPDAVAHSHSLTINFHVIIRLQLHRPSCASD